MPNCMLPKGYARIEQSPSTFELAIKLNQVLAMAHFTVATLEK